MKNNSKLKTINLAIRITETQKKLYEKAADCETKFLSEWIREVLDREAKKIVNESQLK